MHVLLDFKDRRIDIHDNGCGMDKDDLTHAMTIALETKIDGKLGQFGIGMKSACSALGKKFIVRTSKIGSNKEYAAEYDEKRWLTDDSKHWSNFQMTETQMSEKDNWHGTHITISELTVPLYPNQVSNFKDSFGIRYFPYLKTDQISIHVNTVQCKPEKPDIVDGSKTYISIPLQYGKMLTGHVALLKKRSVKGHYGIHLFRNGRLIKAYDKFGFSSHPENANVIGELNLDHVPVNFNKSDFIEESLEYIEAKAAFEGSVDLKSALQTSKSGSKSIPSIESVFRYFLTGHDSQHLDKSVRFSISKGLLNNTKPFELRIGGNTVKVRVKSLPESPLYGFGKDGSGIMVTINKDDDAFGYVKNPLFLIGMIASEMKLLVDNPDFDHLIQKRNHDVWEFLKRWSEKPEKPEFRDRGVDVPRISNYNLAYELVAIHEYLKDRYEFRFQFTALSTLTPYLHNLLGKTVYTIHTAPNHGDYLVDLLSGEFGEDFAVVNKPDSNSLRALLNIPAIGRIIAVREYSVISGSTIATPEKAFADLLVETYRYGIFDKTELRRIFQTMNRNKLIDIEKLQRYGRFVKKSDQIGQLLE